MLKIHKFSVFFRAIPETNLGEGGGNAFQFRGRGVPKKFNFKGTGVNWLVFQFGEGGEGGGSDIILILRSGEQMNILFLPTTIGLWHFYNMNFCANALYNDICK